ncbi:unnamed protein product [Caenorhabditis bovis]|uniref:Serpentine Receptor, class T n=1 Tax=Caenorhabditis bovis TaxID=2654633 RepID=A0A8S1F7G4_9PELO|nr:unnamed protein product [Caenorhabditis bovis]
MSFVEKYMQNDIECSLNYFVRNGFHPHPYYYNCSLIRDPYAIGERRPFWGIYFMTVGTILLSIYIPCFIVIITSKDLIKSSCYKIMTYLGVVDMCCITTNSLATGYFGFVGATFCSYPRAIFFFGALGCGCWMGTCATCILLAINRCCDINHNIPFRTLFKGKTIYLILLVPILFTIYSLFFTKPVIFDSNYMSWFFSPNLGLDLMYYRNIPHSIVNCVVSITTTSIYAYLCLLIRHKSKISHSDALSKTQKQVFIQSIVVCSFNAIAAYIYVYMQFFPVNPIIILIGQIAWQWSHGCICVAYITMNKTIRSKVYELLTPRIVREHLRLKIFEASSTRGPVSTMGNMKIATLSGSSNF